MATKTHSSKEAYERVLRVVRQNAGPEEKLPVMVSKSSVRQTISCSNLGLKAADRALRAAIENDDVLGWHGKLALVDEECLLAIADAETAKDNPRSALVAKCTRLLRDVRGDDDE